MGRLKKRILLIAAAVVSVPLLVMASFYVALLMAASGTWPFEPLQRRARQTELPNGAVIRIEGVEDRGWQGDGFMWTASYRQRNETDFRQFGSWIGPADNLRAYISGPLVVCPNPNLRMIHVRGADGQWRLFDLRLPARSENLAEFSQYFPALATEDLRRFQAELTDAEASYSPATYIQEFDPVTREIRARILTALTREAVFDLSPDGQSVVLRTLRRIEH